VIIYLNEGFEGGETEFIIPHEIIEPLAGTLLLYTHGQQYKNNHVSVGTKYILNVDVMYDKIQTFYKIYK
jgi:hypothetical protein